MVFFGFPLLLALLEFELFEADELLCFGALEVGFVDVAHHLVIVVYGHQAAAVLAARLALASSKGTIALQPGHLVSPILSPIATPFVKARTRQTAHAGRI